MASSLSSDLRERVVKAVAEGASRRQAAARFGVSVASAILRTERQHERTANGERTHVSRDALDKLREGGVASLHRTNELETHL